jgi:hypothetical protein
MVSEEMRKWATESIKNQGPRQVGDSHIPTSGELNNITYLAMKYLARWGMRQCDLAVVLVMCTPKTMDELNTTFVETLAEYIWDHLMGEPENPTEEDLQFGIRRLIEVLYTMNESDRNTIEFTG